MDYFTTLILLLTLFVSSCLSINNPQDANGHQFIRRRDEWFNEPTYERAMRIFYIPVEHCPATQFYNDCNLCHCSVVNNRIVALCRAMMCRQPPQITNWRDGDSCPAGQPFYFRCNDCLCAENGVEAECTNRPCPRPDEE